MASRLHLTLIDAVFEGDTYFPPYEPRQWREIEREARSVGEGAPFDFSFVTLERL